MIVRVYEMKVPLDLLLLLHSGSAIAQSTGSPSKPVSDSFAASQISVLEPLFKILLSNIPTIAIIIGLLVLVKILGSPKFKGWIGERRVRNTLSTLSTLDPARYSSHHDLYLPRHDCEDLTQIDHVVVSPYGIFVIETKNFTGWIFGSENQREWRQQIYRKKYNFQNPLHQNELHVNSLAAHLGLARNRFHSLVVFVGDATFKKEMPENVIHEGLAGYILSRNALLLTPPELEAARARLAELDINADRKASSKIHLAALQARHS